MLNALQPLASHNQSFVYCLSVRRVQDPLIEYVNLSWDYSLKRVLFNTSNFDLTGDAAQSTVAGHLFTISEFECQLTAHWDMVLWMVFDAGKVGDRAPLAVTFPSQSPLASCPHGS